MKDMNEYKHPRSLMNVKQDQYKDTYTKTHYNQTVKRQQQRKKFESSKKEVTYHIQEVLNKITSRFLIRNFRG